MTFRISDVIAPPPATAAANSAEFRGNLAATPCSSGRHDMAVRRANPCRQASTRLLSGMVQSRPRESNKLRESETAYRRAIALELQDPKAHTLLGNVLRRLGRCRGRGVSSRIAASRSIVRQRVGRLGKDIIGARPIGGNHCLLPKGGRASPEHAAAGTAPLSTLHYPHPARPNHCYKRQGMGRTPRRPALRLGPSHDNDRDPNRPPLEDRLHFR